MSTPSTSRPASQGRRTGSAGGGLTESPKLNRYLRSYALEVELVNARRAGAKGGIRTRPGSTVQPAA